MSYDDRVLALFADANPVTDDDALAQLMRPTLKLIEQGEDAMSDTNVRGINTNRPIARSQRSRRLIRGVAAAAIALAIATVGWIAVAANSDDAPDAAAGDAIAVIEEFFQKWSGGDVSGAFALVGDQDWAGGNIFLGPTMKYVVAVEPEGWSWSVTGCTEQAPETYSCRVALVGDPLLNAIGGAAAQSQFKVEDGKLTQVPRVLGAGAAQADRALAHYAQSQDPDGYGATCVGANGRALEENGVVYDEACGAFLAPFLEPLAAELTAP